MITQGMPNSPDDFVKWFKDKLFAENKVLIDDQDPFIYEVRLLAEVLTRLKNDQTNLQMSYGTRLREVADEYRDMQEQQISTFQHACEEANRKYAQVLTDQAEGILTEAFSEIVSLDVKKTDQMIKEQLDKALAPVRRLVYLNLGLAVILGVMIVAVTWFF